VAATTVRGGHHGPAMVATGHGGLVLPGTTRFASCFDPRVACLGLFALGFLGLFSSSLA